MILAPQFIVSAIWAVKTVKTVEAASQAKVMLFIFKSGRVDIHILFHLPCQDSIFCWDFKIYIFSYSKRLLVVSPETHLKVVRRLGNCTIVVFIVCKIHRGVRLGSRRESGYNKSSCFICNSPEMCKNNTKEKSETNSGWFSQVLATDNEPPWWGTHCISPL